MYLLLIFNYLFIINILRIDYDSHTGEGIY